MSASPRVRRRRAPASRSERRSRPTASTSRCTRSARPASTLLLFDGLEDDRPARVIDLDPTPRPDGRLLARVRAGRRRRPGLRLRAPRARGRPSAACGSTATRILLDPYGRGVAVPDGYRASGPGDRRDGRSMKSVVVDLDGLRLGGRPAARPAVRARRSSTRRTSGASPPTPARASTPARRGTYAGFIEKIPYLVDLGVTRGRAAARLPVRSRWTRPAGGRTTGATSRSRSSRPHGAYSQPAGRRRAPSTSSGTSSRRSTGPASRSSSTSSTTTPPRAATDGPTFCYRGLANDEYYLLDPAIGRATPTTAAAATPSTPTSRSSAG